MIKSRCTMDEVGKMCKRELNILLWNRSSEEKEKGKHTFFTADITPCGLFSGSCRLPLTSKVPLSTKAFSRYFWKKPSRLLTKIFVFVGGLITSSPDSESDPSEDMNYINQEMVIVEVVAFSCA